MLYHLSFSVAVSIRIIRGLPFSGSGLVVVVAAAVVICVTYCSSY